MRELILFQCCCPISARKEFESREWKEFVHRRQRKEREQWEAAFSFEMCSHNMPTLL